MSQSHEVTTALSYVRDGIEGGCLVDYRHKSTISWTLDTLAAEVERLEALLARAERNASNLFDEAKRAQRSEQDALNRAATKERAYQFVSDSQHQETLEHARDKQRSEAAEARVAELEAEALNGRHAVFTDLKAQLAAANEQNARLRAALEDVSLLAHCISKAGPLNTPDLETAWRKFDLISVKAAEALVDRKAVLNGEEAST